MKGLVLAAVLAVGSAGYALADDASIGEVVVAETAYNWSGLYVGGQVGYVVDGSADYVLEISANYDYSHNLEGLIGGIYAGYNHQFANGIVLGGEADIVWGNLEDSSFAPGNDQYFATTNVDWTGSARARLGYAIDRFLPYVTGGIAFGQLNFEEEFNGVFYSNADVDLVGWTLGAGGEYALTDNWIVRGEYRYTEFDEDFVEQPVGDKFSVDVHTHDIRIGAAYKF